MMEKFEETTAANKQLNKQLNSDPSPQVSPFESLMEWRLREMEARERLFEELVKIHHQSLWRSEGFRTLQAFCIDRLGYDRAEARLIAIALGAILTSDGLRLRCPEAQMRIESLRNWRKAMARREGFAAYRIFSNQTLLELAEKNPLTIEDLRKVKGFGSKRIEAFGAGLVQHLQQRQMVHEAH